MKVWLVVVGWDYEGENVHGCFGTYALARTDADERMNDGDRWSVVDPDEKWERGSKFVRIDEWKVQS